MFPSSTTFQISMLVTDFFFFLAPSLFFFFSGQKSPVIVLRTKYSLSLTMIYELHFRPRKHYDNVMIITL